MFLDREKEGGFTRVLILASILYLLVRLIILLTSNSEVFFGCSRFIAAKLILNKAKIGIADLVCTPYEGGSLVHAFLGAFLMSLFGERYEVFSMLSLCYSIGFGVLLYYFMKIFFDKKAAVLSLILLALPPTFFTMCTLMVAGNITESCLLTLLIMFLLFKIIHSDRHGIFFYFIFGFVCGFSVWFHYVNLIVVVLSWAFLIRYKRKATFTKQFLIVYTVSFIIGFLPWINYNMQHHFLGLNRFKDSFWDGDITVLNAIKNNLQTLSPALFPAVYRFRDVGFINRKVLAYIYYTISVFSFIYLLIFERKDRKIKFILWYIGFYLCIFLITCYGSNVVWAYNDSDDQHLLPVIAFSIITISLMLRRLSSSLNYFPKIAALILFLCVFTAGYLGNVSLITFKKISNEIISSPLGVYIFGEECDGYADLAKRYYNGLDEQLKAPFTLGLGSDKGHGDSGYDNKKYPQKEMAREYFYYFKDKKGAFTIPITDIIPEKYMPLYFLGMGFGIYEETNHQTADSVREINTLPIEWTYKRYIYAGLAIHSPDNKENISLSVIRAFPNFREIKNVVEMIGDDGLKKKVNSIWSN